MATTNKSVTFITGSLPPIRCGIGFYAERLLQEMARTGQKNIKVISTEGAEARFAYPLQTTRDWRILSLLKLFKVIRANKSSTIHIQYPAVGYGRQLGINLLPYLIRCSLKPVRLVITLHEYHESRWVGKLRDFITIVPSHQIVLSNEADRLALPRWLRRKSIVIPISSSIDRTAPNKSLFKNMLTETGLSSAKPTLLFFGFAHPNKGLEMLVPLLSEAPMHDYQALLITELNASDAYQRRLIDAFTKLNQDSKRIAWTGFLPDSEISAILQEGDYFMLLQNRPLNAKSSTAITAALHGLIIISAGSPDPAATAPFVDLKNARLLYPLTAASAAQAIGEIDSNPAEKSQIKQAAGELKNYFSWANITELHKSIYESN